MKKAMYEQPAIQVVELKHEDIIRTSGELKTNVGGETAKSVGTIDFSNLK